MDHKGKDKEGGKGPPSPEFKAFEANLKEILKVPKDVVLKIEADERNTKKPKKLV